MLATRKETKSENKRSTKTTRRDQIKYFINLALDFTFRSLYQSTVTTYGSSVGEPAER